MASLLDLTAQGDVATITDESKLSKVVLMDPQQLYELWERQPWAAHAIDLEQDAADWADLTAAGRGEIAWNLASFFVGEERVATQFSGLVRAYESQSEEAFLTTQQVDEVRHAQHFNRFFARVVGYDGTFEEHLAQARSEVGPAFLELFDEHLVDAQERLLAEPGSAEAKVDFVVLYHMLIEGTLALTGQFFLTENLERRGILPGFLEGFRNISSDEHRHVAYGTWYLQSKVREDRRWADRIQARLMELMPVVAGVLVPPGKRMEENYEILGVTRDETNTFAFTALTRRLKVIGVDLMAAAV